MKARLARAIRVSRECSRTAKALKSSTPRSALAQARASSVVTLSRPAAELRLGRGDVRWSSLIGRLPGS